MNTPEPQKTQETREKNPVEQFGKSLTPLAVAGMISGNVLGPLFLFGGVGWLLTERYDNRAFVYLGVGIAFVASNILIIRNATKMTKKTSHESRK